MKKLPEEKELLELLEMAKNFEQKISDQCEQARLLYEKCEKDITKDKNAKINHISHNHPFNR